MQGIRKHIKICAKQQHIYHLSIFLIILRLFCPLTPSNFYLLILLFYIRAHRRCILLWLSLVLDDETQYFTLNEDYCSHFALRCAQSFSRDLDPAF